MKVLKDIAAAMDCHPRTAKRWIKKLRVPADVVGHGANKWSDDSFTRLLKLWADFYRLAGTTPQIVRAKFAGQLTDKKQLLLDLNGKISFPQKEKGQAQAGQKTNQVRTTKAPSETGHKKGVRTVRRVKSGAAA